jgi:hypothetical protein
MYRVPSEFLRPKESGLFGLSMSRLLVLGAIGMLIVNITGSSGLTLGVCLLVAISMKWRWEEVPLFDLAWWFLLYVARSAQGSEIIISRPETRHVTSQRQSQVWVEVDGQPLLYTEGP